MGAQAQPVPPVDPGNGLLGETAAQLSCALIQTPTGQRMAMTIRTSSTTLTVLLSKADADQWAASMQAGADQMSASGLILAALAAGIGG